MPVPDDIDGDAACCRRRLCVFGTTVVAFFLAEMRDKTLIATALLGLLPLFNVGRLF